MQPDRRPGHNRPRGGSEGQFLSCSANVPRFLGYRLLPVTRSCTSTQANDTVTNLTGCKLTTEAQTILGRNNGLAVWRQRHNDTLAIEPGTVIGEGGTAEFAKGVGKAIQVLSLVCSAFFFFFWSKPKSVCHLWRLVAGGSECGAVNRAA